MECTPIRALDQRVSDGRRAVIDLLPELGPSARESFWMACTLDGVPRGTRYRASVDRGVSGVPGAPHLIWTGSHGEYIALTDAEADRVDAAKEEWTSRHRRERLEAAPDASTWVLRVPGAPKPLPGDLTADDEGRTVVVLAVLRTDTTEDGRSMGLEAEDGVLCEIRVRALTALEFESETAAEAAKRRVMAAWAAAETEFGWSPRRALPEDAVVRTRPDIPAGAPRLFLARGKLIKHGDRYITDVFDGGAGATGFVEHPSTPGRDALWATLDGARGHHDRIHYRELYL